MTQRTSLRVFPAGTRHSAGLSADAFGTRKAVRASAGTRVNSTRFGSGSHHNENASVTRFAVPRVFVLSV